MNMELAFKSASELARMIREKEVSSTEVLEVYLKQMKKHNPKLNAIVTLDEEGVRKRAKEADQALNRGEIWGELHGVPFTVKDVWETSGIRTTAGFIPAKDYVPSTDATIVAKLKNAGAILIGKTNTPTLALDGQTYNPIFGRTNNPWNEAYTCGGSSGGSAASVVSGMTPFDVGSDLAGSIRIPAAFCGAYSLKATNRLISSIGHYKIPNIPYKLNRDHDGIGPITRSVEDLRLILKIIAGSDGRNSDVPPIELKDEPKKPINDIKIAWTDCFGDIPVSNEIKNAIKDFVGKLKDAGCKVQNQSPLNFNYDAAIENSFTIQGASFTFVAKTPAGLPRWFFRFLSKKVFKNNPVLRGYLRGAGCELKHYREVFAERDKYIFQIENFLENYDAWICPVSSTTAFPHIDTANLGKQIKATIKADNKDIPYSLGLFGHVTIFNMCGNPVVTIPIGLSKDGLPISIQIIGKRWKDMDLLNIAEQLSTFTEKFIIAQ